MNINTQTSAFDQKFSRNPPVICNNVFTSSFRILYFLLNMLCFLSVGRTNQWVIKLLQLSFSLGPTLFQSWKFITWKPTKHTFLPNQMMGKLLIHKPSSIFLCYFATLYTIISSQSKFKTNKYKWPFYLTQIQNWKSFFFLFFFLCQNLYWIFTMNGMEFEEGSWSGPEKQGNERRRRASKYHPCTSLGRVRKRRNRGKSRTWLYGRRPTSTCQPRWNPPPYSTLAARSRHRSSARILNHTP